MILGRNSFLQDDATLQIPNNAQISGLESWQDMGNWGRGAGGYRAYYINTRHTELVDVHTV